MRFREQPNEAHQKKNIKNCSLDSRSTVKVLTVHFESDTLK